MRECEYKREVLDNGLRLVWLDLPRVHSVAVHAYVRAGSVYENRQNCGISHLLEHLHMAATRRHPTRAELHRAFARIPARRNARTYGDCVAFQFEASPRLVEPLLELVADILEIRPFSPKLLQEEQRLVVSELQTTASGTPAFLRTLLGDHVLAASQGTLAKSVRRLTVDQVCAFQRAALTPTSIVVALAGPMSEGTIACARQSLGRLRGSPDAGNQDALAAAEPPRIRLPKIVRRSAHKGKRRVDLGWYWEQPLCHRESVGLRILDYALSRPGARLMETLRYGKASTYAFKTRSFRAGRASAYSISGITRPRRQARFLETVLQELSAVGAGDLDEAWFRAAQNACRYAVERCLDSPNTLAYRIGLYEATAQENPLTIADELRYLDQVSRQDVQVLVRDLLSRERFFLFYDTMFRRPWRSRARSLMEKYLP